MNEFAGALLTKARYISSNIPDVPGYPEVRSSDIDLDSSVCIVAAHIVMAANLSLDHTLPFCMGENPKRDHVTIAFGLLLMMLIRRLCENEPGLKSPRDNWVSFISCIDLTKTNELKTERLMAAGRIVQYLNGERPDLVKFNEGVTVLVNGFVLSSIKQTAATEEQLQMALTEMLQALHKMAGV